MRFVRYVSLVDVVVLVMALFILWLPPRQQHVVWAANADSERYALALAEARVQDDQGRPERDGMLTAELVRRLSKVGFQDWAVEAGVRGAAALDKSLSQWRVLLATSVAHLDRLEATPALEYAKRALAACAAARDRDARVCPAWEEVRMDVYTQHLAAGVASGIDPRKDPNGFRRAGEAALRTIRVRDQAPGPAAAPEPPATAPTTPAVPATTAPSAAPAAAPSPAAAPATTAPSPAP